MRIERIVDAGSRQCAQELELRPKELAGLIRRYRRRASRWIEAREEDGSWCGDYYIARRTPDVPVEPPYWLRLVQGGKGDDNV